MPRFSAEDKIRDAYIQMAIQANYRPESSEDADEADSDARPEEAVSYASRFIAEEDTRNFRIGAGDYTTKRALVYTIEAARQLCRGASGVNNALKLLEMAITEINARLPHIPS